MFGSFGGALSGLAGLGGGSGGSIGRSMRVGPGGLFGGMGGAPMGGRVFSGLSPSMFGGRINRPQPMPPQVEQMPIPRDESALGGAYTYGGAPLYNGLGSIGGGLGTFSGLGQMLKNRYQPQIGSAGGLFGGFANRGMNLGQAQVTGYPQQNMFAPSPYDQYYYDAP